MGLIAIVGKVVCYEGKRSSIEKQVCTVIGKQTLRDNIQTLINKYIQVITSSLEDQEVTTQAISNSGI